MEGIKLVIFDLDGTLSKTDEFSILAIQDVQRQLGFEASSRETIISCYGKAFMDFMNTIFPGADEKVFKEYSKLIPKADQKYINRAITYPGITDMLDELIKYGYELAVCSNANAFYINMVLKALKIDSKIKYVQELEPSMNSKVESLKALLNRVNVKKACMVGDTLFDMKAAKENNIPFIGCRYGYRPYEMEKIENTVSRAEEIPSLVRMLI